MKNSNTNTDTVNTMRTFNKQIQITVEVDQIAFELVHSFDADFKHAVPVAEAIIGRLVASNDMVGMTALYNALKGYDNTINFKVGDRVKCETKVWGYWTPESITDNNTVNREIGECEVIEVNEYSDAKLKIRYNKPDSKGGFKEVEEWVNHTKCSKLVTEEVEAV